MEDSNRRLFNVKKDRTKETPDGKNSWAQKIVFL